MNDPDAEDINLILSQARDRVETFLAWCGMKSADQLRFVRDFGE